MAFRIGHAVVGGIHAVTNLDPVDAPSTRDGRHATVRIRGIYSTALTNFLDDDFEIVQPSPPIRSRFDSTFEVVPADVVVSMTPDRQGVGLFGEPAAVSRLESRLEDVARDTFTWDAPAPKDAVFYGVVDETLGSGAIVDLGDVEGFLPYDRVDEYVGEGDERRIQIARPAPPWTDRRPSLATTLRISGGLLELGCTHVDDPGETAKMADLLPADPPDGWHPRWYSQADDADLESLTQALRRAGDRAEHVMEAIADAELDGTPARIAEPKAGAWVWFGRESRFELDEHRRSVTTTLPGHHRIKAATDEASTAVDFAESVADPPPSEFPFSATTEQFGPTKGDRIAIGHGKPDGRLIVLGRGLVTDRDPDGTVTIEREISGRGRYDALDVPRRAGDVARTTFVEGRWWYATVYRGEDGDLRGTYVNVCTPVELFPDEARYVDLHVDVVKTPDGEVRRVDDDELDDAVDAGHVSESLADRARQVAASLENAL